MTPICCVLGVAAIGGYFTYGLDRDVSIDFAAGLSVFVLLWIVLGFWLGYVWGRRLLVLVLCFVMIRPVLLMLDPPLIEAVVMIIEAVCALPLLVWLYTARVRAYILSRSG